MLVPLCNLQKVMSEFGGPAIWCSRVSRYKAAMASTLGKQARPIHGKASGALELELTVQSQDCNGQLSTRGHPY